LVDDDEHARSGELPLRVFVTGATGYIGRALVRELVEAGHTVLGLTHRREGLDELDLSGVEGVLGDLREPDRYRAEAVASDVIIHLALDPSDRASTDRVAVETLIWAAQRRDEAARDGVPSGLIYTSGCFVLGDTGGTPADEHAPLRPPEIVAFRPTHERMVLAASSDDVAAAVIRPGMVFGGMLGLFAGFFETSVDQGAAAFVGEGRNRWSPVYVGDVARLYRVVAELRAGGIYHAVDGTAVPVATLAAAASEAAGAGGRTRSIPLEEARRTMGGNADALAMDQVLTAQRARDLGWKPEHLPFTESAGELFLEWRGAQEGDGEKGKEGNAGTHVQGPPGAAPPAP
jgi:nucleoside-diphosphate-sugar epimerase